MTRRRGRAGFAGALLAGALALSASGAALAAVDVTIRGSGSSWSPARVAVDRGDTVRWRSVSGTHTVTAFGGNWSKDTRIGAGESTQRTFTRTGIFRFRCTLHSSLSGGTCSGMCGRVRVV